MIDKTGLFFDEELQRLIDSFAYCFNVKITIFSSKMEEMIVGLQNPGSLFCQFVQKKLRLRYRCCHQDRLMCERCEQKDDVVVYHCYAGPSEAVLPVKIDGTLIGYGMLGQFRTSKGLYEEIVEHCVKAGFEHETLLEMFEKQPFFDQAALDNMLRLFSMLLSFAVSREYVRFRRPSLAEQVNHWLDEHLAEPLTLDDLAASVNRSKEAAALVGYQDPFYFSRIYKRVRFTAPSTYTQSIRKAKNEKLQTSSGQ